MGDIRNTSEIKAGLFKSERNGVILSLTLLFVVGFVVFILGYAILAGIQAPAIPTNFINGRAMEVSGKARPYSVLAE
jgi:hypothetical protein